MDTSCIALFVSSYLGPPTNTIRIHSTPSSPLCASRRLLAGNSDSRMNCRSQTLTPSYLRSPCWPWPQEGRYTEIGGSVPESKCRLGQQPLSIEANVGTLREVVTLVSVVWVLSRSRFGYGEEILGQYHPPGHAGTELLDLAANVAEEGIAGRSANEHDGVDGDAS